MTTTHVAFLRAINTGGRRVTNPELVAAAGAIGFADVVAYQASGNLLIGGESDSCDAVADRLSAGLSKALGYEVPAIVRSVDEVRAIAAAVPFGGATPNPETKPQVILMSDPPDDVVDRIAGFSSGADRLDVIGTEVHWWPTAGISTSDLDVRGIEASIGVMTIRTLGTVQRISKRC